MKNATFCNNGQNYRNMLNIYFQSNKIKSIIFLDAQKMILSYVEMLKDWEIAPNNLKLLDKKLGEGQFGIVIQGLLTTGEGNSEIVAVKTLKGTVQKYNYK